MMPSPGDFRPVVRTFIKSFQKQGINRPPSRREFEEWLMQKKMLSWPDAKIVVNLLVLRRVLYINDAGEIYMIDSRHRVDRH
jgi:hypothetical protein